MFKYLVAHVAASGRIYTIVVEAATVSAAKTEAIADADFVALGAGSGNTFVLQRLSEDITIALDQARESTLEEIGDEIAEFNDKLSSAIALNNGTATPTTAPVGAFGMQFNGTNWDADHGNRDISIIANAEFSVTQSSNVQTNYNARGAVFFLKITDDSNGGEITLKIEGQCAITGDYYEILEGEAETAEDLYIYKVYPGLPATANKSANDILPRKFRVTINHGNGNDISYGVYASLIR